MTEELKPLPCPFCGERPKITRGGVGISHWFNVECSNGDCEATVSVSGWATKDSAIKAWNTRSPAWRDDMENAPRDWDHPIMVFGNWYDYPVLVKSCGEKDWGQVDEDGNFILSDDDEPHIVPKPSFWQLPLPPEEKA